ncbi:MAG TPA: glycosyltransferase 87 family protein, partial [bacterium]|nr:glycosyltransferase 87 family protein [bacterium]
MGRPVLVEFAIRSLSAYGRLVAFLIGFGVLFLVFSDCVKRQWDFPVYYLAARALWNGENPYDPARLSALAQTVEGAGYGGLPYLYPPYLARILTPLAWLPYFPAAFTWLAIKCAALEATLFLALFLARIRIHPVSLAVGHIGVFFYRPIALDLNAGNIAILEAALVLGALAAWGRARTGSASALFAFMLSYPPTDYVIHGVQGPIAFSTSMGLAPFVVILLLLGFFMSLGMAAVFKHIPVYYPD